MTKTTQNTSTNPKSPLGNRKSVPANLGVFLKHFKQLTIHPKNAEQLKGLILQLAIQGKLTQKWHEERTLSGVEGKLPPIEPASVLLEKIKEEKAQLIKEKKIKKEKALPEITEDEIPFELPDEWVWCRFQEIYDIRDGTHDSPKDSLDVKTYPLITSKNFKNGLIDFDTARRISEEDYLKVIQRSQVHKGDILFSMIGGNIGNQVEVDDFTDYAIKNVALFKHYKLDLSAGGFLKLFSKFLAMDLQAQAAGGAQPFVSLKLFRNLIIGLPPLEEQHAIVSIVNQLFTEVDQLETQTKQRVQLKEDFVQSALKQLCEAPANDTVQTGHDTDNVQTLHATSLHYQWKYLQPHFRTFFNTPSAIKKLRETILQLAVQGKLTHHWRAERASSGVEMEGASILLEKIKAEKEQLIKDKKIKKTRSTDTIIVDSCNWEKPFEWSEIELQDLFKFIDYRGKTPTKSISGKRLITAKNIRMGFIKNAPVEYVSDEFYKNWMVRGFPKIGDILFVTEGHTMGFVTQINLDYEFALAQRTICFQSYINLDLSFFYFALMSNQFQQAVKDNQTGSAAGGIKASKLKRIPIPFPPLEEQKAIVAKVNSLMALCDQLEQEIEQNTQQVEDLMQSCVKEVFAEASEEKEEKIKQADWGEVNIAAEPATKYGKE